MNKLKMALGVVLLSLIIFLSHMAFLHIPRAFAISYAYQRTVTIDHTKVPSTQTNFTVLVCANGSTPCNTSIAGLNQSGAGAHVQNASGDDIVFSTVSGCGSGLLNWEMENYVASTGEMEAWVSIPSLSSSADTSIYMCYDNASISAFQGGAKGSAWDSNYEGVWHMNDTTYTDSTTNANNGTNTGTTEVAGQIDGGTNFVHASTQYAEVPASASLNNWTYQTVSLWINSPASSMPAYGRVLEKSADNEWGIIFNDGTIDNKIAITDSAVNRVLHSAIPLADGTWHKLDVQWTSGASGAISLYVDGVLDSSTTGNNNVIKTGNVEFGRLSGTPGYEYNGKMDEVQISNNIRSADWIATSYKNQFAPNTFETFGSEGSGGGVVDNTPPVFSSVTPTSSSYMNNVTTSSAISFTKKLTEVISNKYLDIKG